VLPPGEPVAPRRAKKVRPSFDVARADLGGQGARWVYRSDAEVSALAGSVVTAGPVLTADPDVMAPAAMASNPPAAAPPAVVRSAENRARETSEPETSEPGWLALGVGVMTLPLTLTIMTMIAPVVWLAGSRPRR